MKNIHFSTIASIAILGITGSLHAQTTLSGDHVITGNLNVGTSIANGGLTVTGQTGNTAAPGISVTGDGGVVWTGTSGVGLIPATGAGVRLMWYPKKAAFRAGSVSGNQWDDVNVGSSSGAFGAAIASGSSSLASGGSTASGGYSVALGNATASGTFSFAAGGGILLGRPLASGLCSVALGDGNVASGNNSFAAGVGSVASGSTSLALGNSTVASGSFSFALGSLAIASGFGSFSEGYHTTAVSAYSFVIGRYNVVEGNSSSWVDADPLFVVGNGTGVTTDPANVKNRNAFVIYKDGSAKFTKRQGDIEMGDFGTPGSGD